MHDRNHFDGYREQTRVKHEILEKYLRAYLLILKKSNDNLLFIDGFAGPGYYNDNDSKSQGSPLRALQLIADDAELSKRVSTIFIEKDKLLFASLESEIKSFYQKNPKIREPELVNAEFKSGLESLLEQFEQTKTELAPTFLFVDPCGVQGVYFDIIARLMKHRGSEIFLFFNIDGLRRILGLGKSRGPTLAEFFGSDKEADELLLEIDGKNTSAKENAIVARYYDIVRRKTKARFITGFRVEKETKQTVSHYLIHITKHDLGFRIMKSIMWGVGRTESGRGGLALMQKSLSKGLAFLDPEWDTFKASILAELTIPRQAHYFYEILPSKEDNHFCDSAYRQALLELEEEKKILVLDKLGNATSASTRRKYCGNPTLSKDHSIQKRNQQ